MKGTPPLRYRACGAALVAITCVLLVGYFRVARPAPSRVSHALGCAPHPPAALRVYEDLAYPLRTPDLAIDAIIRIYQQNKTVTTPSGKLSWLLQGIVLCHRKHPPHRIAIPGGYVEYGESLEDAVRREVLEETAISLSGAADLTEGGQGLAIPVADGPRLWSPTMRQFRAFSNSLRDKRRHTVSVAFDITAFDVVPHAADDVKECRVYPLSQLRPSTARSAGGVAPLTRDDFAFDHYDMLQQYLVEYDRALQG